MCLIALSFGETMNKFSRIFTNVIEISIWYTSRNKKARQSVVQMMHLLSSNFSFETYNMNILEAQKSCQIIFRKEYQNTQFNTHEERKRPGKL